ncbi:hypothetical protein FACS1894190_07430 [Spirochaetia bacterium]|nr:hypothetical protein FACS1894190_07430 [Spirochaetia bacterium]
MTLYHGSNTIVETPDLTHTFKTVDFGKGFYTTPNKRQAVKFTFKLYSQYVFTSEKALKYLHFINSEEITEVLNGKNN